ncbi:MAG TPA: metal-dependent hydrolase [Gammaproteobacteria bacterium]|nr:metal-dependent hydrolase [Gammaproteobacteria bacterium]
MAAGVVGGLTLYADSEHPEPSSRYLLAAGIGYGFGTLPDILEPAHHPNHRQFCHSIACAGAIAYGVYRAYKWEPEEAHEKWCRFILLAIGGAYLVHLAMDSTTPKGLPLV